MEVDYDPQVISYARLLEVVWGSGAVRHAPWSRQYQAMIMYRDDEQKHLAEAGAAAHAPVHVNLVPYRQFWLAEDYHQKYYLQQSPELAREFSDLVNSTAAARANGYLGGYGTVEDLERTMPALGLSPRGCDLLRKWARPKVRCGG